MHLPIINTCARAGAQVPMILLRILLVVLIVPPVWLAMSLLTAGTRLNAPLQPWRAALLRPLLRFWADALMRIGFGFWRYRVTGAAPRGTKPGYTPTSVCVRARALHTHPRLRRRGSWSAVATAGRSLARCESVRGGPPSHDAPRQQPARVRSAGLSRCSGAAAAKPGPSAVSAMVYERLPLHTFAALQPMAAPSPALCKSAGSPHVAPALCSAQSQEGRSTRAQAGSTCARPRPAAR